MTGPDVWAATEFTLSSRAVRERRKLEKNLIAVVIRLSGLSKSELQSVNY